MVLAGEIGAALANQGGDDFHGFGESAAAMIEGEAVGRVLGFMPARPDAQGSAGPADLLHCVGLLGQHARRGKLVAVTSVPSSTRLVAAASAASIVRGPMAHWEGSPGDRKASGRTPIGASNPAADSAS